ncbi:MAG: pyridoxamine 5'-phosphate oxidase family protein [Alphaproteobacteria bacterium]
MARAFAEIAFTPAVLAAQRRMGSADQYAAFLQPDLDEASLLTEREAAFIAARDGFFQATVSSDGWPYVQFRGGPAGFLKAIDARTLAYADFRGNRQYLSVGNLAGNDRIALILVDQRARRRLKIWGRARLVEAADDPALVARLHDPDYRARPERAVVIDVAAFDWNCPQHIVPRLTLAEIEAEIAPLRAELDRLRAENARLRAAPLPA